MLKKNQKYIKEFLVRKKNIQMCKKNKLWMEMLKKYDLINPIRSAKNGIYYNFFFWISTKFHFLPSSRVHPVSVFKNSFEQKKHEKYFCVCVFEWNGEINQVKMNNLMARRRIAFFRDANP